VADTGEILDRERRKKVRHADTAESLRGNRFSIPLCACPVADLWLVTFYETFAGNAERADAARRHCFNDLPTLR
jgi:hypothetical protein